MQLLRNKTSNRYCGPNALALLTGQHVDDVTRMLRMVSGRPAIKGTHNRHMLAVLERLGFSALPVPLGAGADTRKGKRTSCPTLAKALRTVLKDRQASQRFLVVVGHHYVCIQGRKVWDYRDYPEGEFLGSCKLRRCRVTGIWAVSLKGDQPVPPPAKPASTAMQRARFIPAIEKLGLEVDADVVDAPRGFVFSGTGNHCRAITGTYAEALEDIQSILPLVPCTDPDCDMCQEEN
jgi:hypothetical protein